MPAENPLLELSLDIPFERIFPEQVRPAITELLAVAEENLRQIEVDKLRTYENTMAALEAATERLEIAMGVVGHLESVKNTNELREAYNAVRPDVSAFYAGIPLRDALWRALKEFAATEEAGRLDPARRRHLDKTLEEFRRNGADLPRDRKERLQEISRELAQLTSTFSQNVLDETADYELMVSDEALLEGLPESAKEAARVDAESKGKSGYRLTLHAPSLIPVLTYLENREIREQIWRAYNTRAVSGPRDNTKVVTRILELRKEQAQTLGYPEFAAFVLEDRMAKTTDRARAFVEDLRQRSGVFFAAETAALEAFARTHEPDPAFVMQPWDVGLYSEKQRKAQFDFDEEELRPYFAKDRVMDGLFETARRLYGVTIRHAPERSTWHPDVFAYDVLDSTGEHLASFYADLFPREEKRGGAWMNSLITGVEKNGKLSPHLGLICANVTPALGDRPALLSHSEVTTLFHEFGHLLHHCLSRVEVRSLSGTNVAWDFVELPSQIMENWCWEREALDTFARHHETDQPIPDDLFGKMQRARTYRAASAMMRQLGFAVVDLALHVDYQADRDGPLLDFARRVMQPFAPSPYPTDYGMLASFGHLFSSAVGYAAGYYSYKWAEVLDADAFTRFRREGIFSAAVGNAFRRSILERGDTDDPMELYRRFMGREPSLDALMQRAGLSKAA
jgi:oligopeptidase A